MKRILFVCHGNICRSPMAEFVMKKLVDEAGRSQDFLIASAATSTEEIGNGVYPPARRMLAAHGISCEGKTARQITRQDYAAYDIIIGMDTHNIRNMNRIFVATPRARCGCCSTATWPILGTRAISTPPGATALLGVLSS